MMKNIINGVKNYIVRLKFFDILFIVGTLMLSIFSVLGFTGFSALSICALISGILAILIIISKYINIQKNGKKLYEKNININIKFGNIFKENKYIIQCESTLSDSIEKVSKESVQYKYFLNNTEFEKKNKKYEKYDLIRVNEENNAFLFIISELDKNFVAKCTMAEYVDIIVRICEVIDRISKKEVVSITLVGSNIKITDANMSKMDKLQLIVNILKVFDFKRETSVNIVLHESKKNHYNLSLIN
ncbi:macro domain-containing protein [Macrococcoides canis]|uniref:macro domain-containing protein n=1 Tax=Macrococcoides canis TaxID=1855823 RepID=UPI0022B8AA94|nr:macro domain-containing protein [Macrococcus canis]WBF52472.1 DUF6430 domain-containing protein [Macrococcus canis]